MRYRFCRLDLEIPDDESLVELQVDAFDRKIYNIKTNKNIFKAKACVRCSRLLPLESFYAQRSPCKRCHYATVCRWREQNIDKDREYKRNYKKRVQARKSGQVPLLREVDIKREGS